MSPPSETAPKVLVEASPRQDQVSTEIWNLPNALTMMRIFLVPLLVVVLLTKFENRLIFGIPKELIGAAIFGIASLTDWLDGYLARRRQQVTTLGQLMDPLADKLLVTAAFVSLVQMDVAPAWMVAVILGREFAVTVLRALVKENPGLHDVWDKLGETLVDMGQYDEAIEVYRTAMSRTQRFSPEMADIARTLAARVGWKGEIVTVPDDAAGAARTGELTVAQHARLGRQRPSRPAPARGSHRHR